MDTERFYCIEYVGTAIPDYDNGDIVPLRRAYIFASNEEEALEREGDAFLVQTTIDGEGRDDDDYYDVFAFPLDRKDVEELLAKHNDWKDKALEQVDNLMLTIMSLEHYLEDTKQEAQDDATQD